MAKKKSSGIKGLLFLVVAGLAVVLGLSQLNKTQVSNSQAADSCNGPTVCIHIEGKDLYINYIQAIISVNKPMCGKYILSRDGVDKRTSGQWCYDEYGTEKFKWPFNTTLTKDAVYCVRYTGIPGKKACATVHD